VQKKTQLNVVQSQKEHLDQCTKSVAMLETEDVKMSLAVYSPDKHVEQETP